MPSKHGGKRKGAGRPPAANAKRMYSVRLPEWLIDWLREQDKSQAEIIEDALVCKHKLDALNEGGGGNNDEY